MSIESEIGKDNKSLEQASEIPRHTHNGLDSERLDLREIYKQLLGDGDVGGVFMGTVPDEVGSLPQGIIVTEEGSFINPAWVIKATDWLVELKRRQEVLTELLVKNRFGSTDNKQTPPITYFNKLI